MSFPGKKQKEHSWNRSRNSVTLEFALPFQGPRQTHENKQDTALPGQTHGLRPDGWAHVHLFTHLSNTDRVCYGLNSVPKREAEALNSEERRCRYVRELVTQESAQNPTRARRRTLEGPSLSSRPGPRVAGEATELQREEVTRCNIDQDRSKETKPQSMAGKPALTRLAGPQGGRDSGPRPFRFASAGVK